MRKFSVFILFFITCIINGQDKSQNLKSKEFKVLSDTIQIDSLSINPAYFKVYDSKKKIIESANYFVDFAKALLILNKDIIDITEEIEVVYLPYPEFLTKRYQVFDQNLIVPKVTDDAILYRYQNDYRNKNFKPFDGLFTSGSLSRGVTMGNNQDAVVNSNFNLQIEGRLAKNVGIRASITDNEVPLQEGGYSQRLNEFDQVFIELFSDKWSIKAGDIDLNNNQSYFLKFQKKLAGITVDANIKGNNSNTRVFASGALVRGRFSSHGFNGIDGNQGPYKILGPNNELFVFIVSGSERIYANGVLLKRGENFDYTIDYNSAEISFTTVFPVNSNMRFKVEYQIAENNYTRFLSYDGVDLNYDKLKIGFKYYHEADAKNKPLQQDLTDEQKQILSDAGDDKSQMIAPSVIPTAYDENKILYKQEMQNNELIYIYSNDPDDDLYQVSFSYVGDNNGDYFIKTSLAAGRVYQYIAEVNGMKQGNYVSAVQLIAPEKKQIFAIDATFQPHDKTNLITEIALSQYDQNLFSNLDDDNNQGFATKINWEQIFINKDSKLSSNVDFEYIDKNFSTVERIRNVEFSRDWNIDERYLVNKQDQLFITGVVNYSKDSSALVDYKFEQLELGDNYSGSRNSFNANLKLNHTHLSTHGSIMTNKSLDQRNEFYRWYSTLIQHYSKSWVGAKFNYENNLRKEGPSNQLTDLSYKFLELEGFMGRGDSTKVFAEIGYNYRSTDSLNIDNLHNVNKVHTLFAKSKLIQTNNANLSLYVNYKQVKNLNSEDESVLNSRVIYRQKLFENFITLQTLYETQSGNLPQQEFTYVEVEPGKGFYEWIDFNNNAIQELDEFVIARFQDQAKYVRVLLPNVTFIKTNKNRFSQSINLNATQWSNRQGFKKIISHFNNHLYFLTDANSKRNDGTFNLNPFDIDESKLLNLDTSFKNSLFFNRGQQRFSSTYSFAKLRKKTIFVFGDQDINLKSHQLQFVHKIGGFWLVDVKGGFKENSSSSLSYENRNYKLTGVDLFPQISYLYSKNSRLELFYKYKNKENKLEAFETLIMHVFGANFQYANKAKFSVNTNFNLYLNEFNGNTNSPVAFQMLEGLQPGTNFTWSLNLQKRLTSFLDLNLNYFGRKSEASDTVHTGTVQLRATF